MSSHFPRVPWNQTYRQSWQVECLSCPEVVKDILSPYCWHCCLNSVYTDFLWSHISCYLEAQPLNRIQYQSQQVRCPSCPAVVQDTQDPQYWHCCQNSVHILAAFGDIFGSVTIESNPARKLSGRLPQLPLSRVQDSHHL